MLNPDHLPGRANRNFDHQPYQAWGRSGQGYGNSGRLEYEPWPDRKPDCSTVQRAPLRHFALAGAGMALTLFTGLGIIPVWAILVPLLCAAVAWGFAA